MDRRRPRVAPRRAAGPGPGAGGVRAVAVRRGLRRAGDRLGHAPLRRRPGDRRQAHGGRPRRLAVPEAPAGAAHRGRPRPPERRGVPRLHARLPVLPGRHDHAAGARAAGRAGAHDGRRRAAPLGLRRGRPDVAVDGRHERHRVGRRRTIRRSPRSPRAWPTGTRARTPRSRCPAPASTRSTSTSPTRSAATAAAPGSRSPRRAAPSGSGA